MGRLKQAWAADTLRKIADAIDAGTAEVVCYSAEGSTEPVVLSQGNCEDETTVKLSLKYRRITHHQAGESK